jgi:Na+/melibiose symporter-like transporter
MISPVFSDVIDHSVVITGKREESVYTGIQQFFGRLGIIAQALTFSIIHTLTGFIEGGVTQNPEAIMGIRLHLAVIPTIFIWVGALLFWLFYKLTPEKVVNNRSLLKDMEL